MAAQWAEEVGGQKDGVCKQSFFKSNPISSEPWEVGSVKILCLLLTVNISDTSVCVWKFLQAAHAETGKNSQQ